MQILVYTFRTFPYLEELKKTFPRVIIFGKLKEDLQKFCSLISQEKPDIILGLALSTQGSFFEPKTINQFNRNRKVVKGGKRELDLFVPDLNESNFKKSLNPSNSFCNYSMYKIKNFLEQKDIDIPFSFSHLEREQIKELPGLLNKFNS